MGSVRQHKPVAFQKTKTGRNVVASQYVILNDGQTVGFELGEYDPSLPLIIDPVLSYSVTGIGGSAIAVDAQGQAYVAGIANPAFVPAAGAFQTSPGGGTCVSGPNTIPCPDILIAKLNSAGTDLVYSTFIGGSGSDYAYGIAVDALRRGVCHGRHQFHELSRDNECLESRAQSKYLRLDLRNRALQ